MSVQQIMLIGAIVMSVTSAIAFFAALVISYLSKDQPNLGLLIGAVISNMSNSLSFWIGSSIGSMRKTDIIAGQQPNPPANPPGAAP